ncbi:MAG: DUF2975 domain-containing protein [Candidatus Methanomethylophilaceae archaeon]|nr:DUF2975 domain-containing protein [Candidatus Methanomethylophilaceae archaeon]
MKGNLNTLKKICHYASAAMLVGAVVLAALIGFTLVLSAGTATGDGGFSDLLSTWVGANDVTAASGIAAVVEMLMILSLGLVTVVVIYRFMKAIEREHSPFNTENVDAMRFLSKTYLIFSVLFAVVDWIARESLTIAMFLFFGSILVGVVIYCLALAFRYGSVLQKESDETL